MSTEAAILGKSTDDSTLAEAIGALPNEAWYPEDEFERHLCIGYLRKMSPCPPGHEKKLYI